MTLLDLIIYNLPNTTTLLSELYSTGTSLEDDDLRTTAICTTITSLLDSINIPDEVMRVRDTYSYVESMTEEELSRANTLMSEKELEFTLEEPLEEELPKVYKKTTQQ